MEDEILAYIRETKPTETALKIWISETSCLSFREAVLIVEGLLRERRIRIEMGVVI